MPPPGLMATPVFGGTTPPSKADAVADRYAAIRQAEDLGLADDEVTVGGDV